jgi:hypothetical protein
MRAFLSERRDNDVVSWAEQIPEPWTWAHTAGTLARAWLAYQRDEPSTAATLLRSVIADAVSFGLRIYAAEALELAAALTSWDQPEAAATLLGATAAARQQMGLLWRYPYHEQAVTIAAGCDQALSPTVLTAARERGVDEGFAAAVAPATALLADHQATQQGLITTTQSLETRQRR